MQARIFFAGDFYARRHLCFSNALAEKISQHDFSIVNLEAPIDVDDKHRIRKVGPYLSQPSDSIALLKQLGISGVSLANNHIFDFGLQGLEKTIRELDAAAITHFGAGTTFDQAYKPFQVNLNGIEVAIISVADSEFGHIRYEDQTGGYAWINHPCVEDRIIEMKRSCDHVLVIAHAGAEMIDIPLPEWRDRYKRLCDCGASAVIGHHPHVPQGYERHEGSFIFYSLGEFFFDTSAPDPKRTASFAVSLEFTLSNVTASIIPHRHDGDTISLDETVASTTRYQQLELALSENEYWKHFDQASQQLYEDVYQKYYELAILGQTADSSWLQKFRHTVKRLLAPQKYEAKYKTRGEMLLLHNLRIDTHRYVVQRVLERKYKC